MNSNSEIVYSGKEYKKERAGNSLVEVGMVDTKDLPTGSYYLIIEVLDSGNSTRVTKSKRFFNINETDFASKADHKDRSIEYSEFLVMTESELDHEFELLRPLLLSGERSMYENLNLIGKKEFLKNFWLKMKPSELYLKTDSPRKEFLERIEFCNNRFGISSKQGWRTDRGRIIIKYGFPDDIRKHVGYARNSELWYYNEVEGGCQFVFLDLSGYGELKLVHSTAAKEMQNFDWQDQYLH